jgi:FixJ family two-component response regulator
MSDNQRNHAVVDNDESHCCSLARLLRAAGIQAVTCPSAETFLADHKQLRETATSGVG